MHNRCFVYSSCLGIARVEVGLHGEEKNILDLVQEKEDDAAEVAHHIVEEATLDHVLGRERLDAQHPIQGAVPIPNHPGQVLIHLHQSIDQKGGTCQVTQAKSHDHLPESGHAPDHL